ncbi:MAG: sigma-70 family RNA polymerase sigma factor [Rhodospirillales bacterium]
MSGRLKPTAAHCAGLVRRIAESHDKAAFEEVFDLFSGRLKSYFLGLGTSESDAEELVQETLILVWRRAAQFDETKAGFTTWLFTIARNKSIDRIRKERRPALDPDEPMLLPEAETPPDAALDREQDARILRDAIKTLPPEQSDLIRLAYYEELAHGAIAARLDLPVGTVKSRIRLAMKKLRLAYGAEE